VPGTARNRPRRASPGPETARDHPGPASAGPGTAGRRPGRRAGAWLAIIALLPLAGGPLIAFSALVSVVVGVLPLAFIASTSVLLDRLAGPAGRAAPWPAVLPSFAVAAGALTAQAALAPLPAALAELITRRIDGQCIARLMRAGLGGAPMIALERADVLDRLALARRALTERAQTPGAAAAGVVALIARYAQLVGAVVAVGVVLGPAAALLLAAVTVAVRAGSRGSLTRWSVTLRGFMAAQRRARYVLDTASDTAIAKEARVLGLLPWLTERAQAEARAHLDPLWRERRRIYFAPFLVLTAAALAGTVAVLAELRGAAVAHTITVLGLGLALQAILIPLRMGTFFPESDIQTTYGMVAFDTLAELDELLAAETRPDRAAGQPAAGRPRADIRFEGVGFGYPGGGPVLAGLDLELPAGQSTAIVGLNGAGKTTVVKLLAGLYRPDRGRITVDGTDLRELDPADWQRRIAVIFQDYVRYELDAAANIGLGAPGADPAGLAAAADWAGAAGVIDALPAGLATPLSSRYAGGTDLSGGQWQRIALARALFAVGAGAGVLVLDEPTAQLDVRAEVAFFDRFMQITAGLTTVIISHRFSSVRRADRIVVLSAGRVAEAGRHDDLVAAGGQYARLFEQQARRFAATARDLT
jgi:ATP-binding cassette, subfamily B, bacterial